MICIYINLADSIQSHLQLRGIRKEKAKFFLFCFGMLSNVDEMSTFDIPC